LYKYIERHVAPRTVEFYCRTPQGHRVVRVYLDTPTPRIVAFNESSLNRTPAAMWLSEVALLIARAKRICEK
jgi:hypothetical protein